LIVVCGIAIFIIASFLLDINKSIGAESKDLFIDKKYGELEPCKGCPIDEKPLKYEKLLLPKQGMLLYSRMIYDNKDEIDTFPQHRISVSVYEFTEEKCSKNKLLLSLIKQQEHLEFINIQSNSVVTMRGIYYWISNNRYIKLRPNASTEVPEKMLMDYLSLHPSTVDIQKSDFDVQEIISVQVERSHDIIDKADKMRLLPARAISRPGAYVGMVAQCAAEFNVRCWTGMYEGENVDCPITLMVNDIDRNKEWEKFRKESMDKDIVEEKVNWAGPMVGACDFLHVTSEDGPLGRKNHDLRWLMLDELKMNVVELTPLIVTKQLPRAFIPEVFE